jgi:hypothetical protein
MLCNLKMLLSSARCGASANATVNAAKAQQQTDRHTERIIMN